MLGECVMSLYGINRMLRSRDLGPAQLLPSVEAFNADVHRCGDVDAAFDVMRQASMDEDLRRAIDALSEAMHDTSRRMNEAFVDVSKLGARERLDLERRVEPIGGELQALRDLMQVVNSALFPRPARLTLSELLRGRWRTRPAFVAETVELNVAAAHHQFEADPRVLWGLVERSLAEVVAAGVETPFAVLLDSPCGRVVELGEVTRLTSSTIERVIVELGPSLPIGEQVLAAVARYTGADACASPRPELRLISVAA